MTSPHAFQFYYLRSFPRPCLDGSPPLPLRTREGDSTGEKQIATMSWSGVRLRSNRRICLQRRSPESPSSACADSSLESKETLKASTTSVNEQRTSFLYHPSLYAPLSSRFFSFGGFARPFELPVPLLLSFGFLQASQLSRTLSTLTLLVYLPVSLSFVSFGLLWPSLCSAPRVTPAGRLPAQTKLPWTSFHPATTLLARMHPSLHLSPLTLRLQRGFAASR